MGKGYIYRGYGSEIEDIDVSDIINNNEPIEEVVKKVVRKFINHDVDYGISMYATWKSGVYRYIWLLEDEYGEDIIKNHIGLYSKVINCLDEGEEREELIYWPGKIVLLKHADDKWHFTDMTDEGRELFESDIEDSNRIKKELWNID